MLSKDHIYFPKLFFNNQFKVIHYECLMGYYPSNVRIYVRKFLFLSDMIKMTDHQIIITLHRYIFTMNVD